MKKRKAYIDIARAIAIILVVLGHCDNFNTYFHIEKFNGLFFMPLFIFISGYFSKEKDIITIKELISYLKIRILKLYIFYVKWEVIFLLLTNIFFKMGFYSSKISYSGKIIYPITSIKIFLKRFISILLFMGREPFCGAFWFIISLIFIIFGYSIINYLVNNTLKNKTNTYKQNVVGTIMIISYIIGCIMNKTINIPRISPAFTMMIFYHIGYLSNTRRIKFNNIYISIMSLIILCILYNFGSISMNSNLFPNGLFLMVTSLSGIYLILYISKLIERTILSNLFEYIGRNTLPIIALHFVSYKVIMIIQFKICNIDFENLAYLKGYNNDNIWYLGYVLCGIFIPLLLQNFYKNIKKKGNNIT